MKLTASPKNGGSQEQQYHDVDVHATDGRNTAGGKQQRVAG